jgi:uncharacterized oxidoreductase
MAALATEREEALVESAIPLRNNAGPDEHKLVNEFNAHRRTSDSGRRLNPTGM